jgi:hypothetical protein
LNVEELYEAIRHLTPSERLRLVERVVHDVAESDGVHAEPRSIIGMMADEPDVMDEACKLAMAARAKSRMRLTDA